jgi:lipopolysaccharide transport system ATP-binding protein
MPPVPSSSQPAISLRGVTKTYTLWDNPAARLMAPIRQLVGAGEKAGGRKFTAVLDISLELQRGECLGIVGRNGAGKSTLLQMIAGTVQPTAGEVVVNGRVAALLELGSGFNPDFTGRENVHMNAAILGLEKSEVAAKFDSIVEYSGIAEFIDQPVRTYSSGMTLRLAFAVCVHVDADILIIDEALAVGDARFQFKCHATLDALKQAGKTIIFVSHDTNAVKRMCQSAVLMERGEILLRGTPNDVTNIYTKLITSPHGVEAIRAELEHLRLNPTPVMEPPSPATASASPMAALTDEPRGTELLAEERSHQQISDKEYSYGGELGRIESVVLSDDQDRPRLSFVTGSQIRIRIACRARQEIVDPIYALTLKDVRGQEIFGTNTYFQNLTPPTVRAGGGTEAVFNLALNVLPGVYFISLGWVRLVNAEVQVIHRRYDVLRLEVMPRDRSFGLAFCPTTITTRPLP